MYYLEKGLYKVAHQPEEDETSLHAVDDNGQTLAQKIEAYNKVRKITIHESLSETPEDNGSCYQFNETFIEMRTPMDEMRGGFTFGLGLGAAIWIAGMGNGLYILLKSVISGYSGVGELLDFEDRTLALVTSVLWFGLFLYGLKLFKNWFWEFLNLEAFVQRRILVRFNRKTRMVYLHRPNYAGGIVSLPWDEAKPEFDPDAQEHRGVGSYGVLTWQKGAGGLDYEESALFGRKTKSTTELHNLWEFIRRYMEDGPDAVPKPKLISKFPWPWVSLQAPMIYLWPLFGKYGYEKLLPVFVLLSPLFLIHGIFHWISLLLCWEPKWPKEIEDAGK